MSSEIEIVKRDWKFQARLIFFFLSLGPYGKGTSTAGFDLQKPATHWMAPTPFIELPFMYNSLPKPPFTECLSPIQRKDALFSVSSDPLPKTPFQPFGPGTPKESKKSPERVLRCGAPEVPKECAPESRKSPTRVWNPRICSSQTRSFQTRSFAETRKYEHKRAQMRANASPQKSAKERFRVKIANNQVRNCKGTDMTGPDNGNDWRKFCVIPRSHPLHPLVLYFV